jgi:hypothetical protein
MTSQQAQLDKLNASQQRALRTALKGRGAPVALVVDEAISKATVEFKYASGLHVAHFLMFGPRGRVVYHDTQRIA